MRLLSTTGDEIREFVSEGDIEPYGILSHTWAPGEEVSLQEWQVEHNSLLPAMTAKTGYTKIRYAQQQAKEDGLDWVWVDT